MGGPPAEQIIAGVVLSERLAVTMYGALHRAQFAGQRNLRGLVVDARLLADAAFRGALTEPTGLQKITRLEHPSIVPTFAVESGGADVVVVTRGVGRYVTVQDLIAAARADRGSGGKLDVPVTAAIVQGVVEALAVAHKAGIVHGAVHARSVLIDEDGGVRLGDFAVGRAMTSAVAQGADSSLWRGLTGYIAPELVVGEEPTPSADVYAVGALMFTMLTGEVPPGPLHVTPAVERLVQRALDTDVSRRYRNASDLLENLLEAFEDDRWEPADRGEVIQAAGLSTTDGNIDDATEDLLASLGSLSGAVQVTPVRPSVDLRAAASAARQQQGRAGSTGGRLDALLADLDDPREMTQVEDLGSFKRDPISELIQLDPRKQPRSAARVPSLDDPDDDVPPARAPTRDRDESAAMSAIADLDGPMRRVSTAAEQAEAAAEKLSSAARRAEAAARRVESQNDAADERADRVDRKAAAAPRPVVNLAEIPAFQDLPTPRLKSRVVPILSLLIVIGGGFGFYTIYQQQVADRAKAEKLAADKKKDAEDKTLRAREGLADTGTLVVTSTPPNASVWLKLGRTNLKSLPLTSKVMHRIRIEMDGYQGIDTEVLPSSWSGTGLQRTAKVNVTLKAAAKDSKTGKSTAEPLPARPPNLAVAPKDFVDGEGPLVVETTPPGAEVWLLIGYPETGVSFPTVAGRDYELRALSDGYKPGYASVSVEDWRDGGDPNIPIDLAKKKQTIERKIDLLEDPDAMKALQSKGKPKKGG